MGNPLVNEIKGHSAARDGKLEPFIELMYRAYISNSNFWLVTCIKKTLFTVILALIKV